MTLGPPPRLHWNGPHPRSARTGDIYYSADGVDEVLDVFIRLNDLPARFAALAPGETFRIGETGFGTGFNLLVAADTFERHAPAGARLEFTSVEHQPLNADQLRRTAPGRRPWRRLMDRLIAVWPPRLPGWHGRWLTDRVRLQLGFADATDAWTALADAGPASGGAPHPGIDAWFLDGFAPGVNPDAWSQPLFLALARLSRPHATLATYTVAGNVRRGLAAAGFDVRRVPGSGTKRRILAGRIIRPGRESGTRRDPVCIVGGGIAGARLANELARRGVPVTVHDDGRADAGSRNPWAALHVRLLGTPGVDAELRLRTLAAATAAWSGVPGFDRCGTLHVPGGPVTTARLLRAAAFVHRHWPGIHGIEPATASALAGVPVNAPALWHSGGGRADLGALVRHLLGHPGIRLCAGHVQALGCTDGARWLDTGSGPQPVTGPLVLAAGSASGSLWPARLSTMPRLAIAGGHTTAWTTGAGDAVPRCVLSGGGSVMADGGRIAAGATWERQPLSPQVAARENRARLAHHLPGLAVGGPSSHWGGARCTTRDRRPLVGSIGAGSDVWSLLGFGAAGLALVPLAVDLLLSDLLGEPCPLPPEQAPLWRPDRASAHDVHGTDPAVR